MCGRGFSPSFIFSWPSARTAVMGGAQAAKVMEIITLGKLQRAGQQPDMAQVEAMAKVMTAQLERESSALFGTARLWDDGIIDPRDTRRVLGLCLSICSEARTRTLQPNSFGVARM
jgi:geranyl-CoA carboxylase beta subunit